MQYKVYHAKNPTFGFGPKPQFPQEYDLVALVKAENIEEVFRLTNHIDSDWRDNAGVEAFLGAGRSTSPGDVVVNEQNEAMFCANLGWEKISA